MPCEHSLEQLYLYLDGELTPPEVQEIARHLATCAACQQAVTAHQRLQALLRLAMEEEDMPAQLWPIIQQRLAREAPRADQVARRPTRRWVWLSCGAIAALLLLIWLGQIWVYTPLPAVVEEMVDSHIRTRLMAAPYTPISAQPEAIRTWFRDKVEFAVPVPALPPERYALLGVRLNYFLNRRVAEVAYTTDAHVLSWFMFAEPEMSLRAASTIQVGLRTVSVHRHKGYTAILWQDGDLVCGLVSDLQVTALVALLQQALPG